MRLQKFALLLLVLFLFASSCGRQIKQEKNDPGPNELMVRIAEIEIDSIYFDEYVAILKEESEASVRLEPGVICIYPMHQKEHPTYIRLLEIYADKSAYESHLQTPHFKHHISNTIKKRH